MNAQIKPIRLKHGSVNPAKALLLKLNVPQQLLYLAFEQDHNFCERAKIVPNPDQARNQSAFALQAMGDSDTFSTSFMKRSATTRPRGGSIQSNTMLSNFSSPKLQK